MTIDSITWKLSALKFNFIKRLIFSWFPDVPFQVSNARNCYVDKNWNFGIEAETHAYLMNCTWVLIFSSCDKLSYHCLFSWHIINPQINDDSNWTPLSFIHMKHSTLEANLTVWVSTYQLQCWGTHSYLRLLPGAWDSHSNTLGLLLKVRRFKTYCKSLYQDAKLEAY